MYVVAGATGHVGSVVARELLARKQKVKVLVHRSEAAAAWSGRGAGVAIGSLEDGAFLAQALKGASGVFVLLPPNMSAPDMYAWQRKTADTIAQAVQAGGVPHAVLLSSVGADLDRDNGPIRGLHYLEEALRRTGTALTSIRATSFQENIAGSLAPARQAGIYPSFLPPDVAMPMVATVDIGTLAADALMGGPKNETIVLTGPAASSRQVAEKVGAALGKKLQIVEVPESEWLPALEKSGLRHDHAELFAEMYRGFASGKITPKGDRTVAGTTTIDQVIPTLLA